MTITAPRTMSGVLELLPNDQIAFENMLGVIRSAYQRFGFLPIETPVMEFTKILFTKTGGETERQVYLAQSTGSRELGNEPDLALRFDLTVPLARYVAEHERKLNFPFRRYQIQKVYRGETAQRGRFREFYQCDVDVIGKDRLALEYDAEIPAVIYQVFRDLNVGKFTIHFSNRKIMTGLLASWGMTVEQQTLILREVDKLDKRGRDYVITTLKNEFQLDDASMETLLSLFELKTKSAEQNIAHLRSLTVENESFQQGVDELETVVNSLAHMGIPAEFLQVNLSITRGLDYYTGTVYETFLDDHQSIGSVCSGGRYENLAGHYTKSKLPGVGISIGATRLYYQLKQANLLPTGETHVKALVTTMDASLKQTYLRLSANLRAAGIPTEIYFAGGKFGKQMKYADRAGIRFAIIVGSDEEAQGIATVRDLKNSSQFTCPQAELAQTLVQHLAQT